MAIKYRRFVKGSVVLDVEPGGNVRLWVRHRSYPFFVDDQDRGGVSLERADVSDAADCLRSFADSTPDDCVLVRGVVVEWVEV